MRYVLKYSSRFRKDLKKVNKDVSFSEDSFLFVVGELVKGETLDTRYQNHKLRGKFIGCYECHIQPNVLLIYKIDKQNSLLYLLRIGSHSDLF
jgi:mRNA interferase YafQ